MEELYNKLMSLIADYEVQYKEIINKAYNFAIKYHEGMTRDSGDPYVSHPLNVAIILAEMKADADTICAGLLHDTVEDTDLTKEMIAVEFNPEVAKLVSGVTKISNTKFSSPNEARSANDRKLVLSMTEDIRIVIIKLADRLHNIRTLQYKKSESISRIAYETLDIFAPLANYIGAYQLKNELEDLSLKYLQENIYQEIKQETDVLLTKHTPNLIEMEERISQHLRDNGISNEIKIGMKNIYGIYKRKHMYQKIEFVPELFSLKIAVDDLKSCYYALGLINSKFPPKSGMIEDLIANPKHNTYRSLHSTCLGTNNLLVSIQIRTKIMDLIASYGLTAYWKLNPLNVRERMQKDMTREFQFFNSIREIDATFGDNDVFLAEIRRQLFANKIKVFSPTKRIYYLPENSSILDFIKKLGVNLEDKFNYVLINGTKMELDYVLKDGDQVSIYLKKEPYLNDDNLNSFLVFDRAKQINDSKKDF